MNSPHKKDLRPRYGAEALSAEHNILKSTILSTKNTSLKGCLGEIEVIKDKVVAYLLGL